MTSQYLPDTVVGQLFARVACHDGRSGQAVLIRLRDALTGVESVVLPSCYATDSRLRDWLYEAIEYIAHTLNDSGLPPRQGLGVIYTDSENADGVQFSWTATPKIFNSSITFNNGGM